MEIFFMVFVQLYVEMEKQVIDSDIEDEQNEIIDKKVFGIYFKFG